jgi:protein SCO1
VSVHGWVGGGSEVAELPRGNSRRLIIALLLTVTCLALGYVVGEVVNRTNKSTPVPPELQSSLWPEPRALQAFELLDQNEVVFNRDRLIGKWTLMFFGYTHCPDICPDTLSVMQHALAQWSTKESSHSMTQVVFVSVDPERDSLESLGSYVTYFDKRFIGITGKVENLDSLARQLNVMYLRESTGSIPGVYTMTHTSSILVIDPQARLYARFSPPHDPASIRSRLAAVQRHYNGEY